MTPAAGNEMTVVWTRGNGCSELAALLSEDVPDRITGDLVEQHQPPGRSPRLAQIPGSFDLVSVAVPLDFVPQNVKRVVSAVAEGPIRSWLPTPPPAWGGLGVESEMLSAIRPGDDPREAEDLLDHIGLSVPEIGGRVVEVEGISELVESLEEGTLVVFGAPGGSWLQRSMFGPGARLRSRAPAGAIMVRSAPDRVFRWMGGPVFVSPMRLADDTLRLHEQRVLAVADEGC